MSKRKNFYAIKVGKDVKNIILENWEDCQKYVLYYNSIYKGFSSKKEAKKWLNSWTDEAIEYRLKCQLALKDYRERKEKFYETH